MSLKLDNNLKSLGILFSLCLFLISFFHGRILQYDAPRSWQIFFQDPASVIMEGIIDFHHDLTFIIVVLCIFVSYLLFSTIYFFRVDNKNAWVPEKLQHNVLLEIVWTVIPAVILMLIATPSFALLYGVDEIVDPIVTIKAIGHQWYWHYEYGDHSFGNRIFREDHRLITWGLRLLETNKRVVIPKGTHVRLLTSSSDVLHSWAVPSLGIKLDACPGRLNQVTFFSKRQGIFFGQCSEICGTNHGFMPIVVDCRSPEWYLLWLSYSLESAKTSSNSSISKSLNPTGSGDLIQCGTLLNTRTRNKKSNISLKNLFLKSNLDKNFLFLSTFNNTNKDLNVLGVGKNFEEKNFNYILNNPKVISVRSTLGFLSFFNYSEHLVGIKQKIFDSSFYMFSSFYKSFYSSFVDYQNYIGAVAYYRRYWKMMFTLRSYVLNSGEFIVGFVFGKLFNRGKAALVGFAGAGRECGLYPRDWFYTGPDGHLWDKHAKRIKFGRFSMVGNEDRAQIFSGGDGLKNLADVLYLEALDPSVSVEKMLDFFFFDENRKLSYQFGKLTSFNLNKVDTLEELYNYLFLQSTKYSLLVNKYIQGGLDREANSRTGLNVTASKMFKSKIAKLKLSSKIRGDNVSHTESTIRGFSYDPFEPKSRVKQYFKFKDFYPAFKFNSKRGWYISSDLMEFSPFDTKGVTLKKIGVEKKKLSSLMFKRFQGFYKYSSNSRAKGAYAVYRQTLFQFLYQKYGLLPWWIQARWFRNSAIKALFDRQDELGKHNLFSFNLGKTSPILIRDLFRRRKFFLQLRINDIYQRGTRRWVKGLIDSGKLSPLSWWLIRELSKEHLMDPRWRIWAVMINGFVTTRKQVSFNLTSELSSQRTNKYPFSFFNDERLQFKNSRIKKDIRFNRLRYSWDAFAGGYVPTVNTGSEFFFSDFNRNSKNYRSVSVSTFFWDYVKFFVKLGPIICQSIYYFDSTIFFNYWHNDMGSMFFYFFKVPYLSESFVAKQQLLATLRMPYFKNWHKNVTSMYTGYKNNIDADYFKTRAKKKNSYRKDLFYKRKFAAQVKGRGKLLVEDLRTFNGSYIINSEFNFFKKPKKLGGVDRLLLLKIFSNSSLKKEFFFDLFNASALEKKTFFLKKGQRFRNWKKTLLPFLLKQRANHNFFNLKKKFLNFTKLKVRFCKNYYWEGFNYYSNPVIDQWDFSSFYSEDTKSGVFYNLPYSHVITKGGVPVFSYLSELGLNVQERLPKVLLNNRYKRYNDITNWLFEDVFPKKLPDWDSVVTIKRPKMPEPFTRTSVRLDPKDRQDLVEKRKIWVTRRDHAKKEHASLIEDKERLVEEIKVLDEKFSKSLKERNKKNKVLKAELNSAEKNVSDVQELLNVKIHRWVTNPSRAQGRVEDLVEFVKSSPFNVDFEPFFQDPIIRQLDETMSKSRDLLALINAQLEHCKKTKSRIKDLTTQLKQCTTRIRKIQENMASKSRKHQKGFGKRIKRLSLERDTLTQGLDHLKASQWNLSLEEMKRKQDDRDKHLNNIHDLFDYKVLCFKDYLKPHIPTLPSLRRIFRRVQNNFQAGIRAKAALIKNYRKRQEVNRSDKEIFENYLSDCSAQIKTFTFNADSISDVLEKDASDNMEEKKKKSEMLTFYFQTAKREAQIKTYKKKVKEHDPVKYEDACRRLELYNIYESVLASRLKHSVVVQKFISGGLDLNFAELFEPDFFGTEWYFILDKPWLFSSVKSDLAELNKVNINRFNLVDYNYKKKKITSCFNSGVFNFNVGDDCSNKKILNFYRSYKDAINVRINLIDFNYEHGFYQNLPDFSGLGFKLFQSYWKFYNKKGSISAVSYFSNYKEDLFFRAFAFSFGKTVVDWKNSFLLAMLADDQQLIGVDSNNKPLKQADLWKKELTLIYRDALRKVRSKNGNKTGFLMLDSDPDPSNLGLKLFFSMENFLEGYRLVDSRHMAYVDRGEAWADVVEPVLIPAISNRFWLEFGSSFSFPLLKNLFITFKYWFPQFYTTTNISRVASQNVRNKLKWFYNPFIFQNFFFKNDYFNFFNFHSFLNNQNLVLSLESKIDLSLLLPFDKDKPGLQFKFLSVGSLNSFFNFLMGNRSSFFCSDNLKYFTPLMGNGFFFNSLQPVVAVPFFFSKSDKKVFQNLRSIYLKSNFLDLTAQAHLFQTSNRWVNLASNYRSLCDFFFVLGELKRGGSYFNFKLHFNLVKNLLNDFNLRFDKQTDILFTEFNSMGLTSTIDRLNMPLLNFLPLNSLNFFQASKISFIDFFKNTNIEEFLFDAGESSFMVPKQNFWWPSLNFESGNLSLWNFFPKTVFNTRSDSFWTNFIKSGRNHILLGDKNKKKKMRHLRLYKSLISWLPKKKSKKAGSRSIFNLTAVSKLFFWKRKFSLILTAKCKFFFKFLSFNLKFKGLSLGSWVGFFFDSLKNSCFINWTTFYNMYDSKVLKEYLNFREDSGSIKLAKYFEVMKYFKQFLLAYKSPHFRQHLQNKEFFFQFSNYIEYLKDSGQEEEIKILQRVYNKYKGYSLYWFYIKSTLDCFFKKQIAGNSWLINDPAWGSASNLLKFNIFERFTENIRRLNKIPTWDFEFGKFNDEIRDFYSVSENCVHLYSSSVVQYIDLRLAYLQRFSPTKFSTFNFVKYQKLVGPLLKKKYNVKLRVIDLRTLSKPQFLRKKFQLKSNAFNNVSNLQDSAIRSNLHYLAPFSVAESFMVQYKVLDYLILKKLSKLFEFSSGWSEWFVVYLKQRLYISYQDYIFERMGLDLLRFFGKYADKYFSLQSIDLIKRLSITSNGRWSGNEQFLSTDSFKNSVLNISYIDKMNSINWSIFGYKNTLEDNSVKMEKPVSFLSNYDPRDLKRVMRAKLKKKSYFKKFKKNFANLIPAGVFNLDSQILDRFGKKDKNKGFLVAKSSFGFWDSVFLKKSLFLEEGSIDSLFAPFSSGYLGSTENSRFFNFKKMDTFLSAGKTFFNDDGDINFETRSIYCLKMVNGLNVLSRQDFKKLSFLIKYAYLQLP